MTHSEIPLLPLFRKFISESKSGKRLKKNGKRIKPETTTNYYCVMKNLEGFSKETSFNLRLKAIDNLDKRERETEQNYWKKFYHQFTRYLYVSRNCYDNYVGATIKIIRIFFNYLQNEKLLNTGNYFKAFYVIKEEPPIIALSVEQLRFLIYNDDFRESLPTRLKPTLDYFIIGCTVALRVSDLFNVCEGDIITSGENTYLINTSLKTDSDIKVPLPEYAIEIINKYLSKHRSPKRKLFQKIALRNFNLNLRLIGALAGWTDVVGKHRAKRGIQQNLQVSSTRNSFRFCDLISSHLMRRTAITTMISLGMPEFLARKVSGHSNNSTAFYRYVHLAQTQVDDELKKIHGQLGRVV